MSQQSRTKDAPEAIRQISAYKGVQVKWLAPGTPWLERVEVLTDEVLTNIHYAMVSSEFDGIKLLLRPAGHMSEAEKDRMHELLAVSPDYPNGVPFKRVFSGEGHSMTFKLSPAMVDYMRSIGVYVVNAIDEQYVELI